MRYVMGVDAGTTCFKAALYDETLRPVARAQEEYRLAYGPEGYVEFPAQEYWAIFCRLVRRLLADGIESQDITSLSICSQGETLILLDGKGQPLCNAIVWTDTRAGEQAARLGSAIPARELFTVTGQREMAGGWPAAKLVWVRENQPEIFDDTRHILLLADYLIYRLTGVFATDRALSSSTAYMDIRGKAWWDKMLQLIGIHRAQLPEIFDCGQPVAPVHEHGSRDTGLSNRTIVMSGALDQACGMLGAGNLDSGIVTETTGTCLAVCTNLGKVIPAYEAGLLPVHCGILPGSYYAIYWSGAAGSIYRWLRDVFYVGEPPQDMYPLMDREAAAIDPGSDGLLLLPYHSGMNYPVINGGARGSFSGISLAHTRGHFTRAVLEAIACLLRQSVDEIAGYGIQTNHILSLGGGAANPLWNQIKADLTGKSIAVPEDDETTCLGAAMLAAVGAGLFEDYWQAAASAVRIKSTYSPENTAVYNHHYSRFLEVQRRYTAALTYGPGTGGHQQ